MCKSEAEGGKRCEYSDMIANVRKKARYKYRGEYDREHKAQKAIDEWKEANPEIVKAHLPEKMPFHYVPKEREVPKELLNMMTPSSRTPISGAKTAEERLQKVIEMHEEHNQWKEKLTSDEISAVHDYTMTSFDLINATLRKKGFTHQMKQDRSSLPKREYDRIRGYTMDRIKGLKSAFKKIAPQEEPRKLYRFFRVPAGITPAEYVDRYLKTGEGFNDGAFMSTTADPEFIMAHMHDRNKGVKNKGYVVMEILTKQGQSVQPHPYTRSGHVQSLENEVLLPSHTKLRVVGFNKVQRFEYGTDRKDLHGQYNSALDSYFMFKNYGHHSEGDKLTFPMVKLIDEKLITEYEKKNQDK